MDAIDRLIERVQRTPLGFTDIKRAADEVVAGNTTQDSLRMAKGLFASDVHQARMLATLVLGGLAAQSDASLDFLRSQVSQDSHWRVQEMLAQAFDKYCADIGYERALPVIRNWLDDPNPNVRRAVTELTYSPPILHSGYRGTPRSPRAAFLARPALREGSACTFLPVRSATRSERALACSTVRFSFAT